MELSAKVAVVIPAYNARSTLTQTVESVLCQTLDAIEVWIVDDGSSDGTDIVAGELAEKDCRINVIHQMNSGAFHARLGVLSKIKAEYVGFVDADDTIEPCMYEKLYNYAKAYDLDAVEFDIHRACDKELLYTTREDIIDQIVRPVFFVGKGFPSVCNKIFRRTSITLERCSAYLRTLNGRRLNAFEDILLNLIFFINVNRYGRITGRYYNYIANPASTTRKFNLDNLEAFRLVIAGRRFFAQMYLIEIHDPLFPVWVVHNARNLLGLAVASSADGVSQMLSWVKEIIALPEVREAMDLCRHDVWSAENISYYDDFILIGRVMRWPRLYCAYCEFKRLVKATVKWLGLK